MPDSTNDSNSDKPRIRFTGSGGGGGQGGSSLPPLGGSPDESNETEPSGFEIEDEGESTQQPVQMAGSPAEGETGAGIVGSSKIRTFGQRGSRLVTSREMEPHAECDRVRAIHVRTFHGKLTNESLEFMDQQINEWLDKHPEYEVKMVTSTIGTFSGKVKEPALICQVWI